MRRTAAGIDYELTIKRVKNLNLRIRADGMVCVSVPRRVPMGECDRFVASRAGWIAGARARITRRAAEADAARDAYTDEECIAAFGAVSDRFFPFFEGAVPCKPELRVRWMKSRWGVCHPQKNCITLNKRLMDKPAAALEYVVLHEYVHFLHPDHQQGFHREMARLMPDYKARRALLK